MKWAAVHAAAGGAANDHGHGRAPEVVGLGDEVRDLIEAAGDEIDELHFGDGAQAEEAHAAGRADDGGFADGRFDDALAAEFREQAVGDFEGAAVHADVFADGDDGGIAFHFFEHRLPDGVHHGDGAGRGHGFGRQVRAVWDIVSASPVYPADFS